MQLRPVVTLLLAFVVGCREPGLRPVPKCGEPCGDQPQVGICHRGTWQCPTDEEPYCGGGRGPSPESCDGKDNDCDGQVDEGPPSDARRWYLDGDKDGFGGSVVTAVSCQQPRGYADAATDCNDQNATVYPGAQETCNGWDDNCDGQVDEVDALPVEVCYSFGLTHPTLVWDPCRPGVYRCQRGQKVCVGEILPKSESCDGKDNDCDGQVDEGVEVQPNIDVVVVIDNSCSMYEEQQQVRNIASKFQSKYGGRAGLRGAYVGAPSNNPLDGDRVVVVQNFTDLGTLAARIQTQTGTDGSGFEPTMTTLAKIADTSNPLALNWRAGAVQAVVLVTDEDPQDREYQPNLMPSETNRLLMRGSPYAPLPTWVFTNVNDASSVYPQSTLWAQWRLVVNGTGGDVYDLDPRTDIEATLDKILQTVSCTP